MAAEKSDIGQMIQTAKKLEGSVRNTGIHACGVIITPDDITNFVPVSTAKDSDLLVSQYDNSVAEEAGLLKMDFLGIEDIDHHQRCP
jgi:DNA polymerase-3 subunit alpha